MNDKLPDFLQYVIEEYPEVWKAYQALGEACGTAGPLEPKTVRLAKLALAIGAKSEGAVHSMGEVIGINADRAGVPDPVSLSLSEVEGLEWVGGIGGEGV